jgi:hypothetical protein
MSFHVEFFWVALISSATLFVSLNPSLPSPLVFVFARILCAEKEIVEKQKSKRKKEFCSERLYTCIKGSFFWLQDLDAPDADVTMLLFSFLIFILNLIIFMSFSTVPFGKLLVLIFNNFPEQFLLFLLGFYFLNCFKKQVDSNIVSSMGNSGLLFDYINK